MHLIDVGTQWVHGGDKDINPEVLLVPRNQQRIWDVSSCTARVRTRVGMIVEMLHCDSPLDDTLLIVCEVSNIADQEDAPPSGLIVGLDDPDVRCRILRSRAEGIKGKREEQI